MNTDTVRRCVLCSPTGVDYFADVIYCPQHGLLVENYHRLSCKCGWYPSGSWARYCIKCGRPIGGQDDLPSVPGDGDAAQTRHGDSADSDPVPVVHGGWRHSLGS